MFKKYSQMKRQMKREALQKMNRMANEGQGRFWHGEAQLMGFCHGRVGGLVSSFTWSRSAMSLEVV